MALWIELFNGPKYGASAPGEDVKEQEEIRIPVAIPPNHPFFKPVVQMAVYICYERAFPKITGKAIFSHIDEKL